ncbi:hypothetical protein [Burkholderia multivorans]|uniref:hypothetical protein n=1 Tax=Burkholderia multivorans TaxID=87883 RepID=UPI001C252CF5|nr:hypothetical protein [Burkholderia multivorans]MBU9566271.1 hypothetical protein [Burkholderia multivorans]
MNDQQQSRADALTEAQRKALETAVNVLNINWEHETANELWEAFTAPVSQPAAALIEKPVAWRWREKIDERWRFTRHDPSQLVRRPKFIEPLYLNAQAAAAPINPIALAEQKMSNENAHANETGAEGLDQFERIDVQNHVLRRTLQRVMARLTDLLDEDQFGNIESIVKEAGVEPPAMAAAANVVPINGARAA